MDKEREQMTEKIEMAKHLAKWLCRPEGCWDCEFWNDNVDFDMCCDFENPLKIAEELQKAGYGDTKQAVREFAEKFEKHIEYEIERETNHSKIKAYNKSLNLIKKLLTEVK